jgi:hypothetical protein
MLETNTRQSDEPINMPSKLVLRSRRVHQKTFDTLFQFVGLRYVWLVHVHAASNRNTTFPVRAST